MVQTPLAVLRRISGCPRQMDVAAKLDVTPQRVMNVEAGRASVAEDFIVRLARVLGRETHEVMLAYLESRKAFLRSESDKVTKRLAEMRGPIRQGRRRSA